MIPAIQLRQELEELDPILFELQDYFRKVILDTGIAGGAIRDAFLGVHSNDIDIYYIGNWLEIGEKDFLESNGFTFKEVVSSEYEDSTFKVTHEGTYKGRKLQFMKCKSQLARDQLIQAFPFNIGRFILYWLHLSVSEKALKDHEAGMQEKTIILRSNPANQKYINKLKLKFANLPEKGWTIIITSQEFTSDSNSTFNINMFGYTEPKPIKKTKKIVKVSYKVLNSPDLSNPSYREKDALSTYF